jgi:putative ABC transport system substrate-binding protein
MPGTNLDPVKAGFAASLARPGGNITGLTNFDARLHAKRLELLKEAFPRVSRVVIFLPRPQQKEAMKEVEALGQALAIQIRLVTSPRRITGIESALSAISRERPDGLLVGSSRSTLAGRAQIIDFVSTKRLPAMYARVAFVNDGGLMYYGAEDSDVWRRSITYVDKILKGARPADLPIEQPSKFELVINLKTARKLGLEIPPEFLMRANKVIK